MRRLVGSFIRDESGLTAVECTAIIAVLIPVTFAFTEVLRYQRFARHMASASDGVTALVASRASPLAGPALTQDSSALVDLFAEGAAPLGPQWREGVGVQATLVRFAPDPPDCTQNCAYPVGSIVWTWTGGAAASRTLLQQAGMVRGCGWLSPTAGERPGAATLVQAAFGPDMRLVVDLVYPFKPMLVGSVVGAQLMVRQAHRPTQADLTNVVALSDEVTTCP
jgi:hypothetical protein